MKNIIILLLILVFSNTMLSGQIKKGDLLLGFDIEGSNENDPFASLKNADVALNIGYMISNRSMLGLDYTFTRSNFKTNDPTLKDEFRAFNMRISPYYRYYLKKEAKLMPYTQVRFDVKAAEERFNDSAINSEGIELTSKLGIGVDYFIAPNIALEASLHGQIFQVGDISLDDGINNELFELKVGIKTLLQRGLPAQQNIQNNYLKKGNYKIGGSASLFTTNVDDIRFLEEGFAWTEDSAKGINVSLAPNAKYFKTDNWTLGGGIDVAFLKTDVGHRLRTGLNLNTGYYLRLIDHLYLNPEVGIAYTRTSLDADYYIFTGTTNEYVNVKSTLQQVKLPISVSFRYFTEKNAVATVGYHFEFDHQYREDATHIYSVKTNNLFFGLEYFFAPNISMDMKVQHDLSKRNQIESTANSSRLPRRTSLSFALNYFIFK